MKISEHHPFRSRKAKEQYLKLYDMRSKNWPVVSEAKMVDTSYGQTFVRISGPVDASPVVLLPGAAANSLMWAPNIESLSESYRTYAIDNIYDYGRSVYTRTPKNPNDLLTWLDEFFCALKLGGHIYLIGMSYGGWLASLYALRFPTRLDKLVLLAPAATVLPLRLEFVMRLILTKIPQRYFTKSFINWLFKDAIQKDVANRMTIDDIRINDAFLTSRCFKPRHLFIPTVLKDKELQRLKVPTLFLVGENEKIYSPRKSIQRLNKVAPHIKTDIIPDAGHDLTFVQAGIVNRKILEFLKQPGAV